MATNDSASQFLVVTVCETIYKVAPLKMRNTQLAVPVGCSKSERRINRDVKDVRETGETGETDVHQNLHYYPTLLLPYFSDLLPRPGLWMMAFNSTHGRLPC